ncbi:similar to Saccharomyces cerevisiae YJL059W YHC3 Vacuolar membrane protein involved in the ATP-dependent transport of arginine into the vacuole and possibly in balancing ion homeostasis [Geotrichum candidum]|uniref:Protein BTN n=1 Tax=Geotrichum candidum TaxID=1173061 RepID=A0A0J9XJ99_GEOCN|nr:similar to Saccharomyces cerevisiae YJL059W YHC3 Vacuolar membrane protein involved in the ATP-dependent transport of arginine into the vacuole and possibly in balancing ion homeostasis [Geotrichum candidum]
MNLRIAPSGLIFIAFWLFGLINNVLYVVNLSAAIDLVGPLVPKATVLLADVMPSFLIKLCAPFFVHVIPYNVRISIFVVLSFLGMTVVALSDSIGFKLLGIVLASISSGLGELSFLQLTHFYGEISLAGFSSGTGGAGLVGSFAYLVFTTWVGLSVRSTLLLFSVAPTVFWIAYYIILPKPEVVSVTTGGVEYRAIEEQDPESRIMGASTDLDDVVAALEPKKPRFDSFSVTLARLRPYVVPFMAPLFLVYISEYIINQGISPTLLFPIEEMPFTKYRDAYVTYGTLYQLGVFISRSSSAFVRIRRVYIPSLLQALNLVVVIYQSLYMVIPNVYLVMLLVFYEGLLGGASYVNTFLLVSETVPLQDREFAMGSVGISDSAGVVCAGLISMWLEKYLCGYQKSTGRPWCELP